MTEIFYQIDKELTLQHEGLVIRLEEAEKEGSGLKLAARFLTKVHIDKLAKPLDMQILEVLRSQQSLGQSIFRVSYSSSFALIKLLAATGKLFFQERQLIVDIFSKNQFFYHISQGDKGYKVSGKIISNDIAFPVHDCNLIWEGHPLFFIKGPFLKTMTTEVPWKHLKTCYRQEDWLIPTITEFIEQNSDSDPNAPHVVIDEEIERERKINPFPLLVLKDRTGAFADLWMTYGEEKVAFHDSLSKLITKRDITSEKNWENDLLETDFIRKVSEHSYYYCPLHKVAHALSFLLDLGWTVIDYQGNKILKYSQISLTIHEDTHYVTAKGKLHYDSYTSDVSTVVGNFVKKERFISLGEGHVGLLPDRWEDSFLQTLCEEATLVQDKMCMNLSCFFSLACREELAHTLDISLLERVKLFKKGSQATFSIGESFLGALRPYQQEGVNWLGALYNSGLHGLLADEMGLGKTVQVLAFLSQIKTENPILIVMPSSLLFSWRKEVEKFLGNSPYVHQGINRLKSQKELSSQKIILTSYTLLRMDLMVFEGIDYECVIIDEAQGIKNADTQTAQAVFALKAKFRLSLSGTPMENCLEELWSQFRFLIPSLLGSENEFFSFVQTSTLDPRYLQKIRRKVAPFILRRKKSDVAKDLPEKINQVVWLQMSEGQRRIYDDFLSGVRGNLLKKIHLDGVSQYRIEILEAILRLRQICCHPLLISSLIDSEAFMESVKMLQLLEDLEELQSQKQKAIVYSQFSSMLKIISKSIKEKGWNCVMLDGSTTQREKVVQQFQEDAECTIFLISLKAGGVGLNLTQADTVFLYEPWWNEAVENQAIDRAHRIGRHSPVLAKRYIVAESIEERIMKLKASKNALIEQLFEEEVQDKLFTEESLEYLFS